VKGSLNFDLCQAKNQNRALDDGVPWVGGCIRSIVRPLYII
jgi:hypothetical protein